MINRQRNSPFLILLIVGVVLPGLVGIFAVQAKAIEDQTRRAELALQAGLSSTSTLTSTALPLLASTGSPIPGTSSGSVDLYAFIQAPSGAVQAPYVTLIAFASISREDSVEIRGFIDSSEFVCTDSPCVIYLQGSSRLVFRAYANTGESSDEVIAAVNVVQDVDGYHVTIDTVSQYTAFTDSCSLLWGVHDEENLTWDDFAQFPYQLNTKKTLHTLAAKLILNGIVDASSCPAGGLSLGLNWPTSCGLEKANNEMIAWQNQFDEYIWLASRDHGIPPKILKTLMEYESQFWPANSRYYLDEIGLGQINELGVDVLLRRDPIYYQKVCSFVMSDCSRPYTSLEPEQQKLIRGAVLASVDANCPDCKNGVDLDKAKQSVDLVASLVRANCEQVEIVLTQPYKKPDKDADDATATAIVATLLAGGSLPGPEYDDLWKFTFATYHSGVSCFQEALIATKENGLPVNWENLKKYLNCTGGREYVKGFMENLETFDSYLYEPAEALDTFAQPTIVPTRTPIPTPTVYISNARIIVKVFMDRNGNGTPDDGEWIDAMTVRVAVSNTYEIIKRTENGIAIFDMTGYTPGSGIDVSLPGLYRNETFLLPESGDYVVVFKFDQPTLPTSLP